MSVKTEFPPPPAEWQLPTWDRHALFPLQNVAYGISQRINALLHLHQKADSGTTRGYLHSEELRFLRYFLKEKRGVYSGGRSWHSIFSRHQQVIPGHKCAATVGETDGWIRHGERGEERRGKESRGLAVKS